MEVQILSRKLIAPSSPTPPHLQNLKVSCFDQLAPSIYLPCIFYYPADGENNEKRSKEMEKSLAETLSLFYPLGGRYIKEEFSVECNDMGAEFLEAKVGGFLSQLLEREERESEMASHLVAPLFQAENSPLVIVQFNMFECGGLAIGISITHRIADAFTIGTFINAWATACRIGSEKVHCRPSFQLGSLFPPKEILPSSSGTAPGTDIKIIRRRFVFDGHTLSKLKALARGGDSEQLVKHHPSRVEVVTALIWMALIRVAQARHGHLRPSLLGLTFNMRGKTAMTTPDYSCGNFVNWANAQFMPDDEIKMELHHFVNRVHDAISTTTHDCAKASNSDDIYSMVSSKAREVGEALGEGNVDTYMFSCWCRFPWYEADFGWGKPSWVSSVDVPTGIVMLMDTKDGDGIEVFLALDESSMLTLQQNLDKTISFTG